MDVHSESGDEPLQAPALPRSVTEARPVVIVGTVLFALFLVVTLVAREAFGEAWIICACGVGVGLFGAAVLTAQRRAALRGDRGAQRGLV
ncbi:DUF2530 domain-containing protein [Tsukamurella sp. 1534]|uniref:DUF2530 domain-containing protein n=1 Tax=Tsukamurella sp. 1534 TaxID=1151061 RepID=UPI000594B60B